MKNLIARGKKYLYTSFLYCDIDEIGEVSSENILEAQDYIFIIKEETEQIKIYWAAQTEKGFFYGLKESLNLIEQKNDAKKRVNISFIHGDLVEKLEKLGFRIYAHFCDFWIEDLERVNTNKPSFEKIRFMKEDEYKEAAAVTRACRDLSRGFCGEDDEFAQKWNENVNSCVIVAESDNKIIGACFMNIYGFDSERGAVAWLREIAVHPDYQGRGIGYSLIYSGLQWGKKHRAVRSFLAADLENHNAIKLYKKFGYEMKEDFGEINMMKEL